MSLSTVRLVTQDVAALDGVTPFDEDAATIESGSVTPGLGIITATLPPGVTFGTFQAGQLIQDIADEYLLVSATIVSQSPTLSPGDQVTLRSPDLPPTKAQQVIDMSMNSGIENLAGKIVPRGHLLGFETTPAGPYLVQLTFVTLNEGNSLAKLVSLAS